MATDLQGLLGPARGLAPLADDAELMQALQLLTATPAAVAGPQPIQPQDFFENLAVSGGLPGAPDIQLGVGSSPFDAIAQALVRAGSSFLQVPTAKARTRVEERHAEDLRQVERREREAEATAEVQRRIGQDLIRSFGVERIEPILAYGQRRGRAAARTLATALGVPADRVNPLLETIPEDVGEPTRMVEIRGQRVPVRESDLPNVLLDLEKLDRRQNSNTRQVQSLISSISREARAQVKEELGLGDPIMATKEKERRRKAFASAWRAKALNLAQFYVDAGVVGEEFLDAISKAPPPSLDETDRDSDAASDLNPPDEGGDQSSGREELTKQAATALVSEYTSRQQALGAFDQLKDRLSQKEKLNFLRALNRRFPAASGGDSADTGPPPRG